MASGFYSDMDFHLKLCLWLRSCCTKGAANYHSDEIAALLDIIEEELLVSGKGWAKVSSFHREWTKENSFHACADRSLEAKFKQLVKTTKPTGDAECSPVVEHAYTIDSLINEKVGTWNLDDEDIDDHVSGSEASDNSDKENNDEDDAPPSKRPHVMKPAPAQVHTVNLAPAKCMRMFVSAGLETLNRISASLDSTIQAARTSECAAASFQNVQFIHAIHDCWEPSPPCHCRDPHVQHTPQCHFQELYADGSHSFWGYLEDTPAIDPNHTLLSY
ncbi:uncharacterized protein PHACADRAFT_167178 [Phanerochaete carnosa HHB-10118-sp]|uniref:DUF6818 domain-containing protein n=1 Tax=Phanerochaete carnosa (strain HHB-10118-sp) TaxID=650164 RepID=K5VSW7_PHACS|nr:uncharacterized protein PHACADRAFT_167178 [Phanerochaete carnosa HHB-10118-sp]EKM49845.1 hypothetical protein PHACADRAFT_167178 [Phanerochaete carnosa HHB-10118-sp]